MRELFDNEPALRDALLGYMGRSGLRKDQLPSVLRSVWNTLNRANEIRDRVVLNSAFRETPISVIDHCRNGMTVSGNARAIKA